MGKATPDFDVFFATAVETAANSAGFWTASGFKISVLITVKTVVFAPMPKARVRITKTTKKGFFRIVRAV